MPIRIQLIDGEFCISRLPPDASVPAWADSRRFSSIARTADELSILCPTNQVPDDVKKEPDWKLMKLVGPFDFNEIGILSSLLQPLAKAGISILAVSTFDTDYILVKKDKLDAAIETLSPHATIERE
ncbi:ACT domain-containing protein [Hyaloraphidium curvatum]|nr:ACT domain-containing protein [Hyaloraphidium curvatum]